VEVKVFEVGYTVIPSTDASAISAFNISRLDPKKSLK
jgi:hypothetical protein